MKMVYNSVVDSVVNMKVQIFVMTHKKFNPPSNPIYVPLQVGAALNENLGYIRDDSGDSISELNPYYGELTGMYWLWKNYHDAEDAVAETMLRAYEKIHTLDDKEYFKFWIMQILVNNARMILRKNKRVVCTEEMDRYMLGNSECISDVWETVLALEDELRTIVVLYYYQGFKISEIANVLDLPEGTIKSRLSRARKNLRELLN